MFLTAYISTSLSVIIFLMIIIIRQKYVISKLNEHIRENDKENIVVLSQISSLLSYLAESNDRKTTNT